MKFVITRTSDWSGITQPCKEAVCTHEMVNKDYDINRWEIDIKSLQDLYALINEVGRIIIDDDSIEIYDDYRE